MRDAILSPLGQKVIACPTPIHEKGRQTGKSPRWVACLLTSALLAIRGEAAISVGQSGSGTNSFDDLPALTEWSTAFISGFSSDIMDTNSMDATVSLLEAAEINNALVSRTGTIALGTTFYQWNSDLRLLQSRPTGIKCSFLMATLRNDSGANQPSIGISYDFGAFAAGTGTISEDPGLAGLRVYYSLTGAAGSWVFLPHLTTGTTQNGLTDVVTFSSPWIAGAPLYVIWADDNGVPGSIGASGNVEGTYTIDNFAVTLPGTPISITTQPTNQTVNPSSDVTFIVQVIGPPPLTYFWRFNETNLLSASTNANLTLTNVRPSNSGDYTVVISNSFGSVTSAVAVLSVIARPVILASPTDVTTNTGSTAAFTVLADSPLPLAFQWFHDGIMIPGSSSGSLILMNVQANDAGAYKVVVSNAGGSVTSAVATLNIILPPTIIVQPVSQTVAFGASASVSVLATGTPPFLYQWQFNGMNLSGQTNATLTISSMQPANEGSYAAIVTNSSGLATSVVALLMISDTLSRGGRLVAWGERSAATNMTNNAPAGIAIAEVALGGGQVLALKPDGTVSAWSFYTGCCSITNVPPGMSNIVAVGAGGSDNYVLRSNGAIFGWGANDFGQTNIPPTLANAKAFAIGTYHNLGLSSDGHVFAWGLDPNDNFGQANVPATLSNVVAIAAALHSLGLREDGTVAGWGYNSQGQATSPVGLTDVVAIAAAEGHSVALKRDGTVVAWGDNDVGQLNVPGNLQNVAAIVANAGHSLALRSDGTVVAWGYNIDGQTNVPIGLTNVVRIVARGENSAAIVGDGSPVITIHPYSRSVLVGRTTILTTLAVGRPALAFQWRFNGTNLPGATNSSLILTNVQMADAGQYSALVSNPLGVMRSTTALLRVVEGAPFITMEPRSQAVRPGSNATFSVSANGTMPITFQWQFRGANLSGQTNASLSIFNAQPTESGLYRAILSNPVGSVTSSLVSLTLLFPPPLNLSVQGQGTVTKSPDSASYNWYDSVTLSATPGRWFAFTRWTDGPTQNPRLVTIGTNNNYAAVFSPTTAVETLTFGPVSRTAPVGMPAVFVDGDFAVSNAIPRLDAATISMRTTFTNGAIFFTVDGSTPSIASSLYTGPFVQRRSVIVRAIAYDAGFLNSWEADPVQLIILPGYLVNASTSGGGSVSLTPQAETAYQSNTLVTFVATPDPGWTFLQWLGDATGTHATNTIRVTQSICAQAVFGTMLGTTVVGNGAVMVDPAPALYPYGTLARFTAVPQSGNFFGAWGNAVASTNNPLFFRVTNANPVVSCFFANLSAGQVTLTVLVSGHGNVATTPRGNRFPINQSVSLVAAPEPGQRFLNWTGDASSTATNLTVSLTQSKIVTANFTKRPQLILGPCFGGWRREGFQVVLTAEFGTSYRIEKSGDLIHWLLLERLTNAYGTTQTIDTVVTNGGAQFYRAVEDSTFP